MPETIERLKQISHHYDAFLIDAWGVLYDGGTVFPPAYDCLLALKQEAKTVVILSNAARRTEQFNHAMQVAGVDSSLYNFSLSSGEQVWKNFSEGHYTTLGKRFYYQGPQRSEGIFKGLDLTQVDTLRDADFILNTGSEIDLENAESLRPFLQDARRKSLPMLCANPDLVAIRRGKRGIAAGSIALLYQQLGGHVITVGKPHRQIYEECLQRLPGISKKKILMIGDGLLTDILGARHFGIDSLFIKNGIYQQQIDVALADRSLSEVAILKKLFVDEDATPDYIIDILTF